MSNETAVAPATLETPEEVTPEVSRTERLQQLEDSMWSGRDPEPEIQNSPAPVDVAPEEPVTGQEGPETPTEPENTPEPEDDFTERFAKLAKMERQLREREAALKNRDSEEEELAKLRELKSLAKQDPLAAANALGISINDLTEQTLNEGEFKKTRQVDEVAERLQRLEEATKQQEQAKAQAEQQRAAQQYVDQINQKIDSAGDKYELVRTLNGGRQLVVNTIAEWYQRTGEEMPWERAAQITEDYLTTQKTKEFNQLVKLKKLQGKLQMPGVQTTTEEPVAPKEPAPQRTISNSVASAPATREVGGKVTREERERRIRELAQNLFE